jgi:hypothetical protein
VVSPDWGHGGTASTINFFFQCRPKETIQEIYDENFCYPQQATDVIFEFESASNDTFQ